ncbi:hypothetical protein [Pectobacterium polonicum]|uniref:hypothetical protein n=1 Tax=Pectobacterium polonicum TaxID=2485124 RepID=UPI002360B26C|nr:hypothetical protein [Pectobacterium polonicum]MDC9820197.1 hypothetical protein [Pectobacterium polonicum]
MADKDVCHKKTSGAFFNVAQATARRVTDKDVRHKKTSGAFFNVAQATARRVADKDVRHKKIQKRFRASGFLWLITLVRIRLPSRLPDYTRDVITDL